MEKFAIGLVLGGLGGALLVANNYKMRTLVKKGQEEVLAKLNQLMDEKIEMMESDTESIEPDADILPEKRKKADKKTAK